MQRPEPAAERRAARRSDDRVPGRASRRRGRLARRSAAALFAAILLIGSSARAEPAPASDDPRPSIVFVLVDDLSWDLVRTMPEVRRMQAEGMTLTRFFVTDSRCCPSRASILTGRYPHNHGVLTNSAPDGGYGAWVRQGDPQRSLGVTLQMAGYRTGYAGKYLNGYPASAGGPPDPGWEDFFGGSGGYDGWHYRWNHNGTVEAPVGFTTDVISAHASEFIRGAAFDRRPFLLTLATFAAHRPYVPAPQDRLRFRGLRLARDPAYDEQVRNPPRWLGRRPPLSPRQRRLVLSHYRRRARSLAAVDRMVGAVRAELFAQGLADNTYVVFSSDNGYHHGQHRLTVNKGTAFDSDIRIPMVVVGPGVPAGARSRALAGTVDLAPTFADIARADAEGHDGRSLLGVLRGRPPVRWRSALLVEHLGRSSAGGDPDSQSWAEGRAGNYRALRSRRYTYVEYANGDRELYDHRRDPHQLDNRAGTLSQPDRRRWHALLGHYAACAGARACSGAVEHDDGQVAGARRRP